MNYDQEGTGPALVLLPGLGCDRRMWEPVAKELRRRFTLIHPHTWTLGSSHAASRALGGLLDELGWERVGLAGLSMGGYVAFECLRHWPEKIQAVALLDTTAFPDPPQRTEKRKQVLRLLDAGRFDEVLEAFVASVLHDDHLPRGPVAELMREMGRAVGPAAFAACTEGILHRGSYEEVLREIRVPTLFLVGEADSLTPPEVARRMAKEVPGARVEIVPGAAHMSPLENPARVAQALSAFMGPALGGSRPASTG
ncbi:MAG: alpha/beta hydrolase [Deferrisomatales bacterium]